MCLCEFPRSARDDTRWECFGDQKEQRAPQRSSVPRRPALGLSVAQPNPSVANSLVPRLRVSLRKGVNQIVHGRIGIARCKWREMKPEFEQLQNRNGFVFSVIDITVACQWRDDNSRDPKTCAPTVVSHRRRNMVSAAAILIVRNNNRARVPDIAVLHSPHNICDVLLSSDDIGIAGMLIIDTGEFDE